MFRLHKWILTCLIVFMMAALSACNLGLAAEPTTEPTATAVDLNAINTAAVATVQAQLTLTAAAITPTSTVTLVPSNTPSPEITNTSVVMVETTATPELTMTPLPGATAVPSFTPIVGSGSGGGTDGGSLCQNSALADESVPDGTVFKPGESFTKTWFIQNTGTCVWDTGFYLAGWSGPDGMGADRPARYINSSKDFVQPGGQIIIYIDMVAPDKPGDYVAHWHMYNDSNVAFGSDFTVVIKVVK